MSAALLTESYAALEAAQARGAVIDLWWRDDDVRRPSAELDRLLALQKRFGCPLALAAIPQGVEAELADGLPDGVSILLHGHAHTNHAPAGAKRAEFGDGRPPETMLAELAAGRETLSALFADRFRPIFVPPWNRIGGKIAGRLDEAGLAGLSTHARHRAGSLAQVNTHLDIVDWRAGRGLALGEIDRLLAAEIDRRRTEGPYPLGILTHHLQHDAAAWAGLEAVLAVAADHPATHWPGIDTLFGLGNG